VTGRGGRRARDSRRNCFRARKATETRQADRFGRLVPNLLQGATRRQLLEYRAAFNVDGILLVDADRETVAQVEFDLFSREAPQFAVRRVGSSIRSAGCHVPNGS
jgi:hypothetical protein